MGRFEPTDRARLCVDVIALRPADEHGALGCGKSGTVRLCTLRPPLFHHRRRPLFVRRAERLIDTSKPGAVIRNYDDILRKAASCVWDAATRTRNGRSAAQTWFTYDLIRQHLGAAGSSLGAIVNLVVYLQDMRDFPTFHRVHERFFVASPPALTVIEVGEVGHKGTLIEIEPTAIVPNRGVERKVFGVAGARAPAQMSQVVEAGGLAFLSSAIGVDESGEPVESARTLPRALRAKVTRDIAAMSWRCLAIGQLGNVGGGSRSASVAH